MIKRIIWIEFTFKSIILEYTWVLFSQIMKIMKLTKWGEESPCRLKGILPKACSTLKIESITWDSKELFKI